MKLVSVGTVAFDAIETPFGKTDKIVGGACTYISLSASYFNDNPKLISVVGDDFPKETIDLLHSKNIDTEGLQIKEGEKTFFWSGKYHQDMNSRDTIDTQLNVLETFDPIVPESYYDCDILMLNLTPAVQMNVIKQLPKRPKLIALDTMDFWMQIALDDLLNVIKEIDVLTINDEEARLLSGELSLKKAANKILTMGPKYLIIKKGEHGALLFDKNNHVFSAPALLLEEVFDPTGAGDTFAGGFMGYLSSQEEINWDAMKKAVIVGSAMASFTVEKFGIERLENLSQDEIDTRINQFREMTTF